MIDCIAGERIAVTPETLSIGMVVHLRDTSRKCRPWLVIGIEETTPVTPDLGGWRLMEIGDTKYKDPSDGTVLGHGIFTGRTSVLRPTHLYNFHTTLSKETS